MFKRVKELIIRYTDLNPEKITEESRFSEDLGFDSYDFLAMLGDLEDEFDIEFDMYEMLKIDTIGDILRYVKHTLAT